MRNHAEVIVHPSSFDPTSPNARLAELVAHLAGCPARDALGAVERARAAVGPAPPDAAGNDDRLAVVARAMVLLRKDGEQRNQRRLA